MSRQHLIFDSSTVDKVEYLCKGHLTKTDAIKKAIGLAFMIMKEIDKGNEIKIVDNETGRERGVVIIW